MHTLLVVTAVLEGLTGLALVAFPSRLATLLLGSSLDAPAALTLARVAGVALVALALTCWLTRHDGQGRAARGLVAAMALYHTGVAVVLAHASIGLALSGLGLWPTGTVSRGHDRVVPQDLALKDEVCSRSACPVRWTRALTPTPHQRLHTLSRMPLRLVSTPSRPRRLRPTARAATLSQQAIVERDACGHVPLLDSSRLA